MDREAVAHLHMYVEQRPNETDEETQDRLNWLLQLIEQEGVSFSIHEEYMQNN